jgi:hypothetical protein
MVCLAVADTQRVAASGSARCCRQILHEKDDYPELSVDPGNHVVPSRHPLGCTQDGQTKPQLRSPGMLFYRVLELAVAPGPVRYQDLDEPDPKGCSSKAGEATRTSVQLGATFAEPPVEANR